VTDDAAAAARLTRDIAAREIAPHVADWDRLGAVPADAGAALGAAGLLDSELPAVVRVEVARELGRAGLAAGVVLLGLDRTVRDLPVAALLTGAAESLIDVGIAYAREREVFGLPLARFQVQRHAFAAASAETEAALALVRRVALAEDEDQAAALDAAAVVPMAASAAWRAAETALQVHGGYGYSDDYPVSRMWREVVALRARLDLPAYADRVRRAVGR
jgi:alkylation response protein AidB-like acyl-CoA dehydrogenase